MFRLEGGNADAFIYRKLAFARFLWVLNTTRMFLLKVIWHQLLTLKVLPVTLHYRHSETWQLATSALELDANPCKSINSNFLLVVESISIFLVPSSGNEREAETFPSDFPTGNLSRSPPFQKDFRNEKWELVFWGKFKSHAALMSRRRTWRSLARRKARVSMFAHIFLFPC